MSELNKRIVTSFFLILTLGISFLKIQILFFMLFFVNFFVLDEFYKIFIKIFLKNKFFQFLSMLFIVFYMITFSSIIFLFLINSFEINKIKILFILLICISTDIGGFLFGKLIGGKKLTKISPNKTYSGSLGSFILAIIVGYFFYYNHVDIKLSDFNIFVFIIIISLISQSGDLIISYLKRAAKLKDTGSFLPGHGGILDRIDGILFALPIGVLLIGL